ncbi:MAG TPA: sigma-70 family RNA polymerase sigma factor [Pyrinomonadaceae bacterium]|nr:sigma-70 family RNA polymerase sigma factor [Pyrinomonadaceae bacterium]
MGTTVQGFEEAALPHLSAAYNLARWLTRNDRDAEDVVQEAYLRAFQHFRSFQGGDARPWLLAIVRNTFYTWIRHNRAPELQPAIDEETYTQIPDGTDPEIQLLREADKQMVRGALEKLPANFREIIVLREFEELSYKEIADVVEIPLGTVMSRLARARRRLGEILANHLNRESTEQLELAAL